MDEIKNYYVKDGIGRENNNNNNRIRRWGMNKTKGLNIETGREEESVSYFVRLPSFIFSFGRCLIF